MRPGCRASVSTTASLLGLAGRDERRGAHHCRAECSAIASARPRRLTHMNDGALRDAAAQAAAVTARTMGYRVESSPLPDEAEHSDTL